MPTLDEALRRLRQVPELHWLTESQQQWWSVAEVAERLQFDNKTVLRWVSEIVGATLLSQQAGWRLPRSGLIMYLQDKVGGLMPINRYEHVNTFTSKQPGHNPWMTTKHLQSVVINTGGNFRLTLFDRSPQDDSPNTTIGEIYHPNTGDRFVYDCDLHRGLQYALRPLKEEDENTRPEPMPDVMIIYSV